MFGSLPGGCGCPRRLVVGTRHDSNLGVQGGRQCCDGPQLRIDLGGEKSADSRRILTNPSSQFSLRSPCLDSEAVQRRHDLVHLSDLRGSLLVLSAKLGVGELLLKEAAVAAGINLWHRVSSGA